jgi:hypothetical protein
MRDCRIERNCTVPRQDRVQVADVGRCVDISATAIVERDCMSTKISYHTRYKAFNHTHLQHHNTKHPMTSCTKPVGTESKSFEPLLRAPFEYQLPLLRINVSEHPMLPRNRLTEFVCRRRLRAEC